MYDIIIIGAGPAGIYGTYYANHNGLKVLLIEMDENIGGKPLKFFPLKPIDDFPGMMNITGQEFTDALVHQLESKKEKHLYEIKTNTNIESLEKKDDVFYVKDDQENVYQSKYVILATGYTSFKYRTIDEKINQSNKEIHHYITDLKKFKNKNVVILGGGDSAFDQALLLKDHAKQITIIHRSENFKAHHHTLNEVKKIKNINVITNTIIECVHDAQINLIDNNKKQTSMQYDELLICWGIEMVPNKLSKSDLFNKMFKLEVNEKLESTKLNNLYGVGNINDSKTKELILIVIADMVKVILDIMQKENIKLTYH